jgi:hypothetical protein
MVYTHTSVRLTLYHVPLFIWHGYQHIHYRVVAVCCSIKQRIAAAYMHSGGHALMRQLYHCAHSC